MGSQHLPLLKFVQGDVDFRIFNTYLQQRKEGTCLCVCTGVGGQECVKRVIMSWFLLMQNIVLGHSFKLQQNQHTKNFLIPVGGYMNRPKPFSTQHNIRVSEKKISCKNLTVARKTRSNCNNTFYSLLFLAIVNYFLPSNRQTIQIQFFYKKCCQGKKNEESWYD